MTRLGSDLDHRLARLSPQQRELLLRRLVGPAPGSRPQTLDLPRLRPDPEGRHRPFPLAEIQRVYWAGRSGLFDLGGCGTNVYFELEIDRLEGPPVRRVEAALRQLVERHDVLRLVVLPDGRQRVLPRLPRFHVTLQDLGRLPEAAREAALDTLRQVMRYRKGDATRPPLFDAVISRAGEGPILLHMRVETLLIDGSSRIKLLLELAALLGGREAAPEPFGCSYRDYVLAWEELREHPLYARSREFWLERLDRLPPGPDLPLVRQPTQDTKPRFVFRYGGLPPESWGRLKERARAAGLTPSGALLAAFAEIVSLWSRTPRFSLQLATTLRVPLHADVERMVGNFNGSIVLPVASAGGSFERRAQALQAEVARGLEHQYFTGFEVLREMNRRRRSGTRATLPVVVSSVIEYNQPSYRKPLAPGPQREGGPVIAARSIGIFVPQVILLVTLFEGPDDALAFSWQTVEELFPEGAVQGAFEAFERLTRDLAETREAWEGRSAGTRRSVPGPAEAPASTAPERAAWRDGGRSGTPHRPPPAAPREVEAEVAGLVAGSLGLRSVGPDDDFYDLGGDSMSLVRLVLATWERYGIDVDVGAFLHRPTADRLARLVWMTRASGDQPSGELRSREE